MGAIGKILGGLFGLIGGIVKGLLGIFGVGKQSEYYMEADDDAVPPAPAAVSATPTPVAPAAPAPVVATPAAPVAVVAAPVPAAPAKAKTPSGMTFAPEFMNTTKGGAAKRRRPGPSLSPFMDMARSVGKTPSMG